MIVSKYERLEEIVVIALAGHPHATALRLQKVIEEEQRSYSLQAIYQELRKLIRASVVVKVGDAYSLRFDWLLELNRFAKRTYEEYARVTNLSHTIPEKGDTVRLKFGSLNEATVFWTQLVFALIEKTSDRVVYEYLPHVWFHLIQWHDESRFERVVEEEGITQFLAIVGDTYLDRLFEHFLKQRLGEYSFGRDPLNGNGESYYSVVGDFVIQVSVTTKTCNEIDQLFRKTTCAEEIEVSALLHLFEKRSPITLSLQHNEKKARKLKKKFERFF